MRRIPYLTGLLQRIFVAAAALAVFLLPVFTSDARASEPRWYVGLSVPVMFLDDSESVTSGTMVTQRGSVPYRADTVNEYKTGFKVSGILGREFGNGFRLQVEGFFGKADLSKLSYSKITAAGVPVPGINTPVSGPAEQLGAMVNVWYDFSEGSRWRPFIGGGIGFVRVDWGGVKYDDQALAQAASDTVRLATLPPGASCTLNICPQLPSNYVPEVSGTDTVFAYKVGGGLGYELTNHITLQVGYRFFKTNQLEFNGRNATGTVKVTTALQGHLFEVGVRYRF